MRITNAYLDACIPDYPESGEHQGLGSALRDLRDSRAQVKQLRDALEAMYHEYGETPLLTDNRCLLDRQVKAALKDTEPKESS